MVLLADFFTRLACGLACMMVCNSPRTVGTSYFRTVMLVVLGLVVLAGLVGSGPVDGPGLFLLGSALLAFLGSVSSALNRGLASRWIAGLLVASTGAALAILSRPLEGSAWPTDLLVLGSAATSALLLGSMMAAMLLGHSYLVSPTMSVDPLKRLVASVGSSLAARTLLAGAGLAGLVLGVGSGTPAGSTDLFWWSLIGARWMIGLAGPAIIVWMVWQAAQIRSTQSATGILYVGVFLTFFGEVTGQLLSTRCGVAL